MQTKLIKQLNEILKQFPKYWDNETLKRNQVINDIKARDTDLIKALISDEKIKSLYSTEIDGVLIFDFHSLESLLQYKEYWHDSFTKYRNSIGLTSEGKYLNYNADVVLDFPFKDCVLEGGMTKEENGKNEVYYNEIIARDEIDRLFSPKVFTNTKRYSKDGVDENITDFSDNDNLIIKGNNLIALHSLKQRYAGKIKLIYIDPPYNTGNDGFKYNDRFNHSTWLTFMKNRLEIARELLSDDGAIFVQIDDRESAHLKLLCDDIFGKQNFKETIVVKTSTESGVNAINVKRGERLFKVKEYLLFYSKSPLFRFNPFLTKSNFNINYHYEVIKKADKYIVNDLREKFKKDYENISLSNKEKKLLLNLKIEEYALKNKENIFSLEKNIKKAGEKFKTFANKNKNKKIVEEYINSKGLTSLVYLGGSLVPLLERVITTNEGEFFGVLSSDLWTDISTTPSKEGSVSFTNGKKPEKLIQRIIHLATKANDLVLDFHLGSGTTAAVAHKMNRRYIGVEQMDYINEVTVPRLVKVIEGEQGGISKDINWQGGRSFVYTELKEFNQQYIHQIHQAENTNELQTILEQMKTTAHLNYQVELDKILNTAYELDGIFRLVSFSELDLHQQKQLLIELLDKNQLYIDATEMDDKTLKVNEIEKNFTKNFYCYSSKK